MEVSVVRRRRGRSPGAGSCRELVRWLAERSGCSASECTILLCDDTEIEALNRRFLDRARPTDVLAFPAGDPVGAGDYLGDIAISLDTAGRHADRHRRTLEEEVHRLIVHGFLHLLGFDHETDDGRMRRRERALWRQWRRHRGGPQRRRAATVKFR